jgi:hypothetical protein
LARQLWPKSARRRYWKKGWGIGYDIYDVLLQNDTQPRKSTYYSYVLLSVTIRHYNTRLVVRIRTPFVIMRYHASSRKHSSLAMWRQHPSEPLLVNSPVHLFHLKCAGSLSISMKGMSQEHTSPPIHSTGDKRASKCQTTKTSCPHSPFPLSNAGRQMPDGLSERAGLSRWTSAHMNCVSVRCQCCYTVARLSLTRRLSLRLFLLLNSSILEPP